MPADKGGMTHIIVSACCALLLLLQASFATSNHQAVSSAGSLSPHAHCRALLLLSLQTSCMLHRCLPLLALHVARTLTRASPLLLHRWAARATSSQTWSTAKKTGWRWRPCALATAASPLTLATRCCLSSWEMVSDM